VEDGEGWVLSDGLSAVIFGPVDGHSKMELDKVGEDDWWGRVTRGFAGEAVHASGMALGGLWLPN
jgi:hypothetical protein